MSLSCRTSECETLLKHVVVYLPFQPQCEEHKHQVQIKYIKVKCDELSVFSAAAPYATFAPCRSSHPFLMTLRSHTPKSSSDADGMTDGNQAHIRIQQTQTHTSRGKEKRHMQALHLTRKVNKRSSCHLCWRIRSNFFLDA